MCWHVSCKSFPVARCDRVRATAHEAEKMVIIKHQSSFGYTITRGQSVTSVTFVANGDDAERLEAVAPAATHAARCVFGEIVIEIGDADYDALDAYL